MPGVLLSFHPITAHRSVFAFKSQAAKSCGLFEQMLRKFHAVAFEERQILLRQLVSRLRVSHQGRLLCCPEMTGMGQLGHGAAAAPGIAFLTGL